jgi:hypothetical protein
MDRTVYKHMLVLTVHCTILLVETPRDVQL